MRETIRLLIILLSFLVSVNVLGVAENRCSAATYEATGKWSYSLTNEWIDGVCYWNRPLDGTVVITQTGDNVEVVDSYNGAVYTGTVSGTNYTMSGSYPDEGGTTTITINLSLTSNTSGSGSWTVHWTDGTYNCNGGADISIIRISDEVAIATGDMDGNGNDEVIVDFGPGIGLWVRMNNSTWVQLHTLSPELITCGDMDGNGQEDVIVDFGPGIGLVVRMNNSTWVQLHTLSPELITCGDMDGNGQEDVIVDFGPGIGLWVRMNNTRPMPGPKSTITSSCPFPSISPHVINSGDRVCSCTHVLLFMRTQHMGEAAYSISRVDYMR